MVKKSYFNIVILLVLAGCSVNNPLRSARNFQKRKNYVAAIEHYDSYIKKADNLELITIAEIERAECYYFLGLRAVEKENWELASRLLFLSNSKEADEELDLCYVKLAEESFAKGDSLDAISNYQKIKEYLPGSEYREEALFQLISFYHKTGDDSTAFENYLILNNDFPESENVVEMGIKLNPYVLNKAEAIYSSTDSLNYLSNINELEMLLQLNLPAQNQISSLIAELYRELGDRQYDAEDFQQAFEHFEKAIVYDSNLKTYFDQKKSDFIDVILQKAEEAVDIKEFDKAISIYNSAFEVFPDNDAIKVAKLELNRKVYNADLAEKAFQKAEEYYENEDFSTALNYYRQSYSYLKTNEVNNRIRLMENLIKAEADPKAFALEIIMSYQKGMLDNEIADTFREAQLQYGVELVQQSGWKVLFYTGKYKFEVRNDILTPGESFYFAWMVDLTKREITPLNKISENLLEGINPYEN